MISNRFVETSKNTRFETIDFFRGITLASMILYHFYWDLVYIANVDIPINNVFINIWQKSILYSFIVISGFCAFLSKHFIKRSIIVFLCGIIISLVTYFFVKDTIIIYGILNFLGFSMFIVGFLKNYLKKINYKLGIVICFLLFLFTRNITSGYIGFQNIYAIDLSKFRLNLFTAIFGLYPDGFYSADYVPLVPWIFLYLIGFYLSAMAHKIIQNEATAARFSATGLHNKLINIKLKPFNFMGKHSLIIYIIHQPILYVLISLILR